MEEPFGSTSTQPFGRPVNYVTVWDTSRAGPETQAISTLNALTGTIVANAAIVTLDPATSDLVSVYASDATDLVMYITGYFASTLLVPPVSLCI